LIAPAFPFLKESFRIFLQFLKFFYILHSRRENIWKFSVICDTLE